MRKLVAVAVSILALTAGFGVVQAFASAGAGGGRALVFTERIVEFVTLDLGAPGKGQGDRIVYRSDLLDQDGKRIGTGGSECVLIAPSQNGFGVTNCLGFYVLRGGELVFAGRFDATGTDESGTLAITGGTGRYAGAAGTVDFEQVGPDTFRDEVHLVD